MIRQLRKNYDRGIRLFSAFIMTLLGICLGAYSRFYVSEYDTPKQETVRAINNTYYKATASQASFERPESTPSDSITAEEEFIPSLTKLNMAFLYSHQGEGNTDTGQVPYAAAESYAAQALSLLSKKDANWLASIYEIAEMSPEEVAVRFQLPRENLLGTYNPSDPLHNPDDSSSWVIHQWENVTTSFINEQRQELSSISNKKDILSMANTFLYYKDPKDFESFCEYIQYLWDISHSISCQISSVYYCGGELDCQTATPSQAADAAQLTDQEISDITESGSEIVEEEEKEIGPGVELIKASLSEAAKEEETAAEAESVQQPACPGHVDLYITAMVRGESEADGSLFSIDSMGGASDETIGWNGWDEKAKEETRNLAQMNWAESFQLPSASDYVQSSLTKDEISAYLSLLPDSISQERTALIEYALYSVGRLPYYWGGKPSTAGYMGNEFGSVVEPDEEGRILKGLDCSGWISWLYWSALGQRLEKEGTAGLAGCGIEISKEELQPGDILLRLDEEPHGAVFLAWAPDGKTIVIHETSGSNNNVIVSATDNDWTSCRRLLSN